MQSTSSSYAVEVMDDDDDSMMVEPMEQALPSLDLEPLSQQHLQLMADAQTSLVQASHQPATSSQQLWVERQRSTMEDRATMRRTQALRALRTQLIPTENLRYRAAETLSTTAQDPHDTELAQLNPRDMTDDQLIRWRKMQHDDQWAQYTQVHRDRCHSDFLYHFMFSDLHADHAARCLRYFRLLSAVENLVVGQYGSHLASDTIARWRWYAIPPNWSPRAWSTAVNKAKADAIATNAPTQPAVERLIDSWLRSSKTSPSAPSYSKKRCEEWLLLTLAVHAPEFSAYLLADTPRPDPKQQTAQPLLVDRVGTSMLLITGDGRQVNRPGQPLRFWSIAQLWMRAAQGQPMDPNIGPLAHTNRSIERFTEPSPEVFCGPLTPCIASTIAPHEHTMAATPFSVVRYFIEQYPLVTRVLAPQKAHVTQATGSAPRPTSALRSSRALLV